MSKVVSTNVCFTRGHNIQSLLKAEALDPDSKVLVSERIVICIQCGKSHDEILQEKPRIVRKKKPEENPIDNV
jgi:hypothetical protein